MTDKPDGKRLHWIELACVFAVVMAPVAYMGAYYATYTMPHLWGHHHYYMIGSDYSGWEIPIEIADPFFAPAHWIDHQTIRRGLNHD